MFKLFRSTLLALMLLSLSACSNNTTKMPKYDANSQVPADKAIVVIGTNNVTYFDIKRYGKTNDVSKSITAERSKPQTKPKPEKQAKQQQRDEDYESADPTKLNYTKSSFNLRRLWDPNSPKTLDGHMDNENNQDNDVYEADVSSQSETTKLIVDNKNSSIEYRIHKPNRTFNIYNYTKSIYTIEPGIYYISFAFYEHNSAVSFTRLPGITPAGMVQYGAFNIKPGDVLYLGDIDFDWVDMDKPNMVKVIDNFNDVQKDLISEGYRDLAIKIKPAQFYKNGTKIITDSKGVQIIITK